MSQPCDKSEVIATIVANNQMLIGDVKEIKHDVKTLLEHKWKTDGRTTVIASIVSFCTAVAVGVIIYNLTR